MLLFWRREWQPTPVLLPGESHGQRSLVGYSPLGRKKWDMTERLTHTHTRTHTHTHTHIHTVALIYFVHSIISHSCYFVVLVLTILLATISLSLFRIKLDGNSPSYVP